MEPSNYKLLNPTPESVAALRGWSLGGAGQLKRQARKEIDVYFEIIGEIENIETIAVGGRIREIMRLRKQYGPGRWRKLKGITTVQLWNGSLRKAEVHWYEAHGIGRKKMKIKRFLD